MNRTDTDIIRQAIDAIDAGKVGAYGEASREGDRGYLVDALAGPVDAETRDDALSIANEYLTRCVTCDAALVAESGDVFVGNDGDVYCNDHFGVSA